MRWANRRVRQQEGSRDLLGGQAAIIRSAQRRRGLSRDNSG